MPDGLHAATLAVRGGQVRSPFAETSEALYLTQGYVYASAAEAEAAFAGEADRFQYSRYSNPTVSTFEERLRLLEGAEACTATATGMSAVFTTLAALVKQGSRVVAGRAVFGSTTVILDELLAGWGAVTEYVDAHDVEQWAAALATPADVVFFETPTNPMQDLVDIAAVSQLAHDAGAVVVVDNVFATPILFKPLEHGADVVVYSATKHIDGQGRVLGGAILGPREFLAGPVRTFLRHTGPSLSPFNAWVLLKGLETLELRVRHQTGAALEIARWLEARPEVASVRYPYLDSHPQAELARRQQTGGGTVVTFTLAAASDADAKSAAFAFLDALQIVDLSNNLGDAKSIITHPATTTHQRIGAAGRAAVGIAEGTLRLSVGLEDPRDLVADLERGLLAAGRA
ncbi:MAG: O-succinylhomoserine sulfhydrylase [Actinomycetales bacterium]|nr:O-succinylhomoserine sulfhydrylase [Actinomycetales bacterium]